jgi:divalent metal cation (Fe/Co/Zn/Cd) transporter
VQHLRHPAPINKPIVNYIVLGLAALFEGWSWTVALRQFKRHQGSRGFFEAFRRSKDPPTFLVLFEDSAALVGISIAAIATVLVTQFHVERADGVASILIGLLLATIAALLAQESKSLLIGEQADPALRQSIVRIAKDVSQVEEVHVLFAVQLSPDEVVVALQVRFPDSMRAPELAKEIKEIERRVQEAHPEVLGVFVRPRD